MPCSLLLAKSLGVDIAVLLAALKEHDIVIDFRRICASGYKGVDEWVYPGETVPCTCCGDPVVRSSGQYTHSPPCERCGACKGMCYNCEGCM
jgi:hypothetical protein